MPTLTVHLREGFFRTPVVIRINGQERFRSDSVTTRMQIGLADQVLLEVDHGPLRLEIEFPDAGRTIRETVDVTGETHLGVDLDEKGHASVRVQGEPFRYM